MGSAIEFLTDLHTPTSLLSTHMTAMNAAKTTASPYILSNWAKTALPKAFDGYNQLVRPAPILKSKYNPINSAADLYLGTNVKGDHDSYKALFDQQRSSTLRNSPLSEIEDVNKKRENKLTSLITNDVKHMVANPLIEAGVGQGADKVQGMATAYMVNKAVEKGSKWLDKIKLPTLSKGVKKVGERIVGDSDKLGLMDVGKLLNPAPGIIAGVGHKISDNLIKRGLMGVLGVQDAYHATTNSSAKKILESGINPSFGANRVGATRQIVKESVKRDKEFPNVKNLIIPSMETSVAVPTQNFIDNAIGRSYVGKGAIGKGAVGFYAIKADPEGWALKKNKITEDYGKAILNFATDPFKHPIKKLKALGGVMKNVAYETPKNIYEAYEHIYSKNPDKVKIVAKGMPFKAFHEKFEIDPDDVAYLRTGHRTRRREIGEKLGIRSTGMSDDELDQHIEHVLKEVDKESVEPITGFKPGELSYKDIWEARTHLKDYPDFLRTPGGPTHLAKGVGLLGAGAYTGYKTLDYSTRPYRALSKKILGDAKRIKSTLKGLKGKAVTAETTIKPEQSLLQKHQKALIAGGSAIVGAGSIAGAAKIIHERRKAQKR